MKNGTKLQIINQMCKRFSMFLKKSGCFFLLLLTRQSMNNCFKSNRQLNSRSAACSSFKYKKEKSYLKKTINVCLKPAPQFFRALLALIG